MLSYSEKRIRDLTELLDSIELQHSQNLEIILVIERSKAIQEFADSRASRFPKKLFFSTERIGVSRARNIGVGLASGEIIAFVDDDAILSLHWSECLLDSFRRNPDAIGVTGRAIPSAKSIDLRGFPSSLYWALGCTPSGLFGEWVTNFATGTNMAFRRKAFISHRFELDIYGDARDRALVHRGLPNDENDFAVRLTTDLSLPILFNDRLVVFHKVYTNRLSPRFVMRYSFWQGVAEARYTANPAWKRARQSIRARAAKTLLRDLLPLEGPSRGWISRCAFVIIGIFFLGLGFIFGRAKISRL